MTIPTDHARLTVDEPGAARDRRAELERDVRTGMAANPRTLPPKWFYDARGSELFEQITRLPEYYQTRTETAILEEIAAEVVSDVRPAQLVEIGSGSSRKTRVLLEAMHRLGTGTLYTALDVSRAALGAAAGALLDDYGWLEVRGVVGDFQRDLHHLGGGPLPRLVAFLGSTIGNLEPDDQVRFLADMRPLLEEGGALLLGVDLVKDPATLQAAYDDAAGVTAAFNRNVLRVVQRELGADVPVDAFAHEARWDADRERIEMWLVATRPVTITVPSLDTAVSFERGQGLRTEISCKFTRQRLKQRCADAGLRLQRFDTDPGQRFAVTLLTAA